MVPGIELKISHLQGKWFVLLSHPLSHYWTDISYNAQNNHKAYDSGTVKSALFFGVFAWVISWWLSKCHTGTNSITWELVNESDFLGITRLMESKESPPGACDNSLWHILKLLSQEQSVTHLVDFRTLILQLHMKKSSLQHHLQHGTCSCQGRECFLDFFPRVLILLKPLVSPAQNPSNVN